LNVFLDSSALAKRYLQEPGSNHLEEILPSATSLGVSVICLAEMVSAFCRLRREGKMSAAQYLNFKGALLADIEDCSVPYVTDEVLAGAVELLERWPLRSSEALQVSSAAEWAADLFVSADARQCAAARGYGLHVRRLPLAV